MPFLTYPLALIALVGIPVLVGIYFLRNRFREQPVSSLMLWAFAARVREGGTRVRRMVMPLVFFLEMLALLLLVLAAVDVRWPLSRSRWPVFVVLDDSVSMLAGAGRETPRERAAREVQRLARGGKRPFRFILAGKNPRVLETHGSGVSEALRGWTCASASACLERATTLACELGGPRSSILVLTDHQPPGGLSEGAKVRWLAFGKPLPNAGIVAAARTPTDKKDRAFLEVAAFAPDPVRTVLV
ncbi:MAG: hypothetical protein FJ279_25315, partial [Planctomycetes bacterium]|nr:hypothetical protein [Planctomycetota bacterium]